MTEPLSIPRLTPLLTLQDIADIAHVRRPVVSMWRSRQRSHGDTIRFPEVAAVRAHVEYFERDAVTAWIERTGRGNNAGFARDAHAAAVPDDVSLDDVAAMLTLAVLTDTQLANLDDDAIVDMADGCDPDDEFLFAEVDGLGRRSHDVAVYVDGLRSLSFGPADAYHRLCSTRLGRGQPRRLFSDSALSAFTTIVGAIAAARETTVTVEDASGGRNRLVVDIAAGLAESDGVEFVLSAEAQSPDARRQRRDALLRGLTPQPKAQGATVAVLSVMSLAAQDAITAIDDVQLSLPKGSTALVVGPSSLLCDRLDDADVEAGRDAILRSGTLRFAARLPRGLLVPAPRQALGLWVFGSQTGRRIADRAVALADLAHGDVLDDPSDDLINDIIGALTHLRGRAFRYCRLVATSDLIAERELVPPGATGALRRAVQPAEAVVRLEDHAAELARALPALEVGFGQNTSTELPQSHRQQRASLRTLVDQGQIRVISGSRLDTGLAGDDGTVQLFEPVPEPATRYFDPLELQSRHPRAVRTEPDDVVFTQTPRPAARVDVHGGSTVAYPARILRISPTARVGPHTLAHTITRLPDDAREWKSWHIPLCDADDKSGLEATLASVDALQRELTERLGTCRDLANELTDAVAAQLVTITTEEGT